MAQAPRDNNSIPTLIATSNADGVTPVVIWGDPATHRLLVDVVASAMRVVAMADGVAITPTGDTADLNSQVNTQSVGTLTVNAPSGTPTDGQRLMLRLKTDNIQTFAWNAIYRGSGDIPLPEATSQGTKTYYFEFIYNSTDSKWDCIRVSNNYS
jgi:hypothetical protein